MLLLAVGSFDETESGGDGCADRHEVNGLSVEHFDSGT
jgi:hypothetical protein